MTFTFHKSGIAVKPLTPSLYTIIPSLYKCRDRAYAALTNRKRAMLEPAPLYRVSEFKTGVGVGQVILASVRRWLREDDPIDLLALHVAHGGIDKLVTFHHRRSVFTKRMLLKRPNLLSKATDPTFTVRRA